MSWREIATSLRIHYGLGGLVAMRLAHGQTQADVATAWNDRWPDDPKTFKNISYWEIWPGRTGHAPSLVVLDRLAQLYACDVVDLIADWGTHGSTTVPDGDDESETLAWQARNLDLHQLTRVVADWSERLPPVERHSVLLKVSTAIAIAASSQNVRTRPSATPASGPHSLTGRWASTYGYESSGRNAVLDGNHTVDLRMDGGALVGRSLPQPSGSVLDLHLTVEGSLATGTWTERTSPTGYYRAATYHGLLQMVVDPTGRSMSGRWLGLTKRYTVKSGGWRLERVVQDSLLPVTTATTVSPASISPSEIEA